MAEIRINETGTLKLFDADDSHSASIKAGTISADVASITLESGETVFNEDSADIDFRIEGNGDANLLFVDAGNDKVGIGTNSPPKLLSLKTDGSSAAMGIDVHNLGTNTADDALITFETQGHRNYSIGIDRSLAGFVIAKSDGFGTPHLILDDNGNLGLGTTSVDVSTQAGGSGFRVLQIENDEGGQINLDHNDAGTGSTLGQINFMRAGEVLAEIEGVTDGATDNGKINFRTQPNGGALTTRWTIDHDGIIYPGSTSQGIALGVTAATASNILDDYEVGTFTPHLSTTGTNFSLIGYATQTGEYVKVGDLVIAHVRLTLNALTVGSPTGNVRVSGLPFTSKDTTDMASSIGFTSNINYNLSSFGTLGVGATTGANATTLNLTRMRNSGTADGVPHQAVTSSSTDVNAVAIYKTA